MLVDNDSDDDDDDDEIQTFIRFTSHCLLQLKWRRVTRYPELAGTDKLYNIMLEDER